MTSVFRGHRPTRLMLSRAQEFSEAGLTMSTRSPLHDVDAILTEHTEPGAALAALRATVTLPALIAAIHADPLRLARLAQTSYRHDNGFDKIVLAAPSGNRFKLVLHVWQEGYTNDPDNIHNHRWDFASVVLCGALQFELYAPDQSGVIYPVVRYRSPGGSDTYELSRAGSARVSVHASMIMAAGTSYSWTADLLHRASGIAAGTTATLIVQGPSIREETTVLVRGVRVASDGAQPVERLGEAELHASLD